MNTMRAGPNALGIYLNDHLAGATAGTELARRAAGSTQDREEHAALRDFAAEVAQDRAALLDTMAALGIPVRTYKVCAAWIGEKAGRRSSTAASSPGHRSAAWKSWNCCGSAWRARPRAGVRCGFSPIPTNVSIAFDWTSSSPGPGGRPIFSKTSGSGPPSGSSDWKGTPELPPVPALTFANRPLPYPGVAA